MKTFIKVVVLLLIFGVVLTGCGMQGGGTNTASTTGVENTASGGSTSSQTERATATDVKTVKAVLPEAVDAVKNFGASMLTFDEIHMPIVEGYPLCVMLKTRDKDSVVSYIGGDGLALGTDGDGYVAVCKKTNQPMDKVIQKMPDISYYPLMKELYLGLEKKLVADGGVTLTGAEFDVLFPKEQGFIKVQWKSYDKAIDSAKMKEIFISWLGDFGVSADYGNFKEDHGEMFYTGTTIKGYLIDVFALDNDGDGIYDEASFYISK
ncbi:hypothetical protein GM182_00380 [bacterium 3DAC]|nr:hypothetical protein GM182_00380 [bacterium 3DAC]